MALKLNEKYPGRFNNPSADYPQGSFKNRTTPTSEDGSYFEQAWANDQLAFFSSLLAATGVSANGDVDRVGASQYYTALSSIISNAVAGYIPPLPEKYFSGFVMANDTALPNTTISVGSGAARDSSDSVNVKLTSPLRGILQASGSWAAGDNQNKLDAGARAPNTWYHVFAIRKTSDGSADILLSLSLTGPTMPPGYSGFALIDSIRTDSSGNIIGFLNIGRTMYWKSPVTDVYSAGVASPGSITLTLRVPTGYPVKVRTNTMVRGENCETYLRPTGTNPVTLGGTDAAAYTVGIGQNSGGSTNESVSGQMDVITDNLARVVLQNFAGTGNNAYAVTTISWERI